MDYLQDLCFRYSEKIKSTFGLGIVEGSRFPSNDFTDVVDAILLDSDDPKKKLQILQDKVAIPVVSRKILVLFWP